MRIPVSSFPPPPAPRLQPEHRARLEHPGHHPGLTAIPLLRTRATAEGPEAASKALRRTTPPPPARECACRDAMTQSGPLRLARPATTSQRRPYRPSVTVKSTYSFSTL